MIGTPLHSIAMFHRFLLTLFAALLLLCAGVSGVARAAALTVAATSVERIRSAPAEAPADAHQGVESAATVELADAPMLPVDEAVLPLLPWVHRAPAPVLDAGHPAPCLDGLLRPPCGLV